MIFLAMHVGVVGSTASNKPKLSQPNAKGSDGMRLKLVLIASFVAAIVGSGASIAIILGKFSSLKGISAPDLLVASTFILPVAAVVVAAIFVYRHTARRRKTQALLTGILGAFLSLAIFILASVLTSRATPTQPPAVAPRNVG
jgi:purine-cytosine permease-like protein